MSTLLARGLAACMLTWSAVAGAQAPVVTGGTAPADTLTLREAVALTLERNPQLKAFAFALRAQDARIEAAALRPALELAAGIENALGTGAASGLDASETTLSLSRVVELGGKRERRLALAGAGREAIDVARAAAQLDVLAEVSRRFIAVAKAQRETVLANQAVELARRAVDAAQRRVDAARSPQVELARARVALTRAGLAVRNADQQLLSGRRKLAAMWGDDVPSFGGVAADLFALPRPASFESLLERAAASPDFARFTTEARMRDAELRLAEARRRPDVEWSAGVRRLQATRDQALVLGFSMPLSAARQAAPAMAEARALRGQVDAERDAARVRTRAQLQELHAALHYAIEEAGVLRTEVLPLMQQAVRDTEYAYERGRYGQVELLDAQRSWLEAESAHLDAAARTHELQNEIERLTGQPLVPEPEFTP
jgi:cobalt-zinc-cadmium efflux system outer membrane protein